MPGKFWFVNKRCIKSGKNGEFLLETHEWGTPAQDDFH